MSKERKMIDCVGVANLIANKQNKVYARWQELMASGMEPIRRQCMATLHSGLQHVRDQLPCESTGSHYKILLGINENRKFPISELQLKEMLVHAKEHYSGAFVKEDAELWKKQIAKIEKRIRDQYG